MDRISTTNKAANLFGAGKHGFKDGDLALGIVPTEFNAAFFNDLQEELLAIIEAGGVVPTAGTRNQILQALRAAGVHQTPAQFDNSTKAATAEFVKKSGLVRSAVTVLSAATALTVAHAGSEIVCGGTGGYTLTLPAASTYPDGAGIEFFNASTGSVTVSRAGTDNITISSGNATSLVLGPGDTLTLVARAGAFWMAQGGSVQLASAAVFGSSLATSGYQKLPSGLILQWVQLLIPTANTNTTVTWPIAFPNACMCVEVTANNTGGTYQTAVASSLGASAKTSVLVSSSTNGNTCVFAIGY